MGLFSGSKKSTSSTSNNLDQQIANLSDIDAPVVTGKGNVVAFSDSGAIQAAVDMQRSSVGFLGDSFADALGFVESVTERVISSSEKSSAQSLQTVDKVSDAFEEAKGTINMEVILIVALAFPVVMMFASGFRK